MVQEQEILRKKILNIINYFAKNTKKCGKTKLYKLLFFADFIYFKQIGKSITGLTYKAFQYGPVPIELLDELKKPKKDTQEYFKIGKIELDNGNKTMYVIKPMKDKIEKQYFTKREIKIIEDVSYIFRNADANAMVESSHLPNEPWQKTIDKKGMYEVIDYNLALDGLKGSLNMEQLLELEKQDKEINKVFEHLKDATG